MRDYS